MLSLVYGVDSIVSTLSPIPESFGPCCYPCQLAYRAFHLTHFSIHCIARSFYWRNPTPQSVGGDILNFTFGDRTIVKKSAQTILVARAVFRSIDAQKQASQALIQLSEAFTGPIYTSQNSIVPDGLSHIVSRMQIIFSRLIDLIRKTFWLSYSGVEILDAIVFDRYTEFMSISGVWQNGQEVWNKLSENLEDMADELSHHNQFVDKLLQVTRSPMSAKDLTDQLNFYIQHGNSALNASSVAIQAISESAAHAAQEARFVATGEAPKIASQANNDNASSFNSSRGAGKRAKRLAK